MKLFIGEFITGGGLRDQALPEILAHEGDMILRALLNDLFDTGRASLLTTRDDRLCPLPDRVNSIPVTDSIFHIWPECLSESDAAIIIAPETGRILYQWIQEAAGRGCPVLGSRPDAVELTTSKRRTIEYLGYRNIPVVPPLDITSSRITAREGYVVKPDDGVGAEKCCRINSYEDLIDYLEMSGEDNLVQEFVSGTPASLSLLCLDGHCRVLAANEQLFEFRNDGRGVLYGIIINGLPLSDAMTGLADAVAAAVPGLGGFVGIDLILTADGPRVLEINPRLTTAYAGLRQSLDSNPAEWLLSLHEFRQLPDIHGLQYRPVTLSLENT